MKTKTYKVYQFHELSKTAQNKVLEEFAQCNVSHDWWEPIFDDAKQIGFNIRSFDLCGKRCEGTLSADPLIVVELIKKNHGKKCETYKTAMRFSRKLLKMENDEDNYCYEKYDRVSSEFCQSLSKNYAAMLQSEYDYQTSKKAIKDSIEANGYWFTEDGRLDTIPD